MSLEILGEQFDIHGGGDDLVFPHHENEIAQAEGAGHRFARHWLHSGMVNAEGVKMSKSLGNFVTLQDVLDRFDPRAFRLLVLQTHYRRQMEFGEKELADAEKAVERLDSLVRRARRANLPRVEAADTTPFRAAMDDDFDTPAGVAVLFEFVRRANAALQEERSEEAAALVTAVWDLAGALGIEPHDDIPELDDEIAGKVARRDEERARGNYAAADALRDELRAEGIQLEDTPTGTVWRRVEADEYG
jgi:cysteinyl-tRNA synthetase